MYCVKFGWNRSRGSGEEYFKFVNVLLLFSLISPYKGTRAFVWTNLNSRHQKMHCANFVRNFPSSSTEEDERLRQRCQRQRRRTMLTFRSETLTGPLALSALKRTFLHIEHRKSSLKFRKGTGELQIPHIFLTVHLFHTFSAHDPNVFMCSLVGYKTSKNKLSHFCNYLFIF